MGRHEERLTGEMIAEAEAMLTGQVIEWCEGTDDVPAWAIVNALAHADWPILTGYADGSGPRMSSPWSGVLTFLADEVRTAAGSDEGLVALQRAELVPLELDLLGAGSMPVTPSSLVGRVRSNLGRARSRQRHPSVEPVRSRARP